MKIGERTHADTNTREDWLRRRALKVPAPRYLFVSKRLLIVPASKYALRHVVAEPHGKTYRKPR